MNEQLKNDLMQLDSVLEKVKEQGLNFLNNIGQRATSTQHIVEKNETLVETGLGTMGALQLFNEKFEPVIVAAAGPRYWGFVTGGSTPAAIAGDWLTSVYDQNTQTTKGYGDISASIELETIQLLLNLFELPNDFLGGFVRVQPCQTLPALLLQDNG